MSVNKSNHVFYLTEFEGHTFSTPADHFIAAVLLAAVLIGLPGNILALIYFWGKRKASFPDVLYTMISAVDICTCILTTPVIYTLFSSRRPLQFFMSYTVCGLWYLPFYFTLRFSQFMVLIISVTRTITLLAPFHRLKKRLVLLACFIYAVYVFGVETLFLGLGVSKFFYFSPISSCTTTNAIDPPPWGWSVLVMNNLVNLILLSVIVFISFVVSTFTLTKGSTTGDNQDFRRVTITITIFTAVFLVCNLPLFLSELLNNIFFIWNKSIAQNATKSPVFVWYFLLVSYRVLTPVNAALNPCVYLWRMSSFRTWIRAYLTEKRSSRVMSLRSTQSLQCTNYQYSGKYNRQGSCQSNTLALMQSRRGTKQEVI